ncbi:MAG: cysteine methyltransferase [Sulfitobacter sp.]|nr:MAG: cysteine methyltransferase [Sulfitobacter sp.]
MSDTRLPYCYYASPIGNLLLAGTREEIRLLSFPTGSRTVNPKETWFQDHGQFSKIIEQLSSYFAGELVKFDLPLKLTGTTFQKSVWNALLEIKYGETVSYSSIASQIGRPNACRAVGAANGANPIPIIIPCHRVIGTNKTLTGFGGGLPTKEYLLRLEGTDEF